MFEDLRMKIWDLTNGRFGLQYMECPCGQRYVGEHAPDQMGGHASHCPEY